MKMKRSLLLLVAVSTAATAFAQTNPPVQFGIKIGPNFSSYTSKADGDKTTSKMLTSLAGGVYANIPLADEFAFQPSLLYEGKGGKEKDVDIKTTLSYLEIPLDFIFRPSMSDGSRFFVGVGPYVGYGIGGKTKGTVMDVSTSFDPFKEDGVGGSAALKRFDAGASVQLGYEFAGGFNIGINSELGLINIANNGDSKNSFRNTSFGVSLGYTFGSR